MRNLELLKLRFGESNLHFCEVMIKDMVDSRRINTHVLSQLKKEKKEEEEEVGVGWVCGYVCECVCVRACVYVSVLENLLGTIFLFPPPPTRTTSSSVPRPFPPPLFDHLQYANTEGEDLGNLVTCST